MLLLWFILILWYFVGGKWKHIGITNQKRVKETTCWVSLILDLNKSIINTRAHVLHCFYFSISYIYVHTCSSVYSISLTCSCMRTQKFHVDTFICLSLGVCLRGLWEQCNQTEALRNLASKWAIDTGYTWGKRDEKWEEDERERV